MAQGTVKWFNETKGFGFIAPDDGGDDLFIHISNVLGDAGQSLPDGAKVEFESRPGRKGQEAYDLRLISA